MGSLSFQLRNREKIFTTKCFISLRSPTEDENGELRHAGMDGRHPGVQDASGDIHVGLDSSTPCWNDGIEDTKTDRTLHPFYFQSALRSQSRGGFKARFRFFAFYAFFVVDHRFLLSGLCVRSMVRGLLHQAGFLGDLLHRLILFTHLGDEFFRRGIILDHA